MHQIELPGLPPSAALAWGLYIQWIGVRVHQIAHPSLALSAPLAGGFVRSVGRGSSAHSRVWFYQLHWL